MSIQSTGIHEIMPNKYTFFVTHRIEVIIFKLTSSPNSYHVVAGKLYLFPQTLVVGTRHIGHGHFRRDVVPSTHEHIYAVQVDGETFSPLIHIFLHSHCSQSCSLHFLHLITGVRTFYCRGEGNQVGGSQIPCPPNILLYPPLHLERHAHVSSFFSAHLRRQNL